MNGVGMSREGVLETERSRYLDLSESNAIASNAMTIASFATRFARRRFGGIVEKPLRPKLVQTFGGRSERPTPDMVESYSQISAYSTAKRKKKKNGVLSEEEKQESLKSSWESKQKRNRIKEKMQTKKEKRYTNVGGTLIPSKGGSVDWRGKEKIDRMRIAVPKPTAAGYGHGKIVMGSLEEETTMDKLEAIKEKQGKCPKAFLN